MTVKLIMAIGQNIAGMVTIHSQITFQDYDITRCLSQNGRKKSRREHPQELISKLGDIDAIAGHFFNQSLLLPRL
jgi:hypothetical protein